MPQWHKAWARGLIARGSVEDRGGCRTMPPRRARQRCGRGGADRRPLVEMRAGYGAGAWAAGVGAQRALKPSEAHAAGLGNQPEPQRSFAVRQLAASSGLQHCSRCNICTAFVFG